MRLKFKRTIKTIETHEVLTVRKSTRVFCPECSNNNPMLTLAEAACEANVGQRTVCRWIDGERIHFVEKPNGELLVCLAPLGTEHKANSNC